MNNTKLILIATIIAVILLLLCTHKPEKKVTLVEEGYSGNLVLFYYMDRCPHCVKIKPLFQQLLEKSNTSAKFVMIKEYDAKYSKYSKDVPGFPTIVVDDGNGNIKYFVGYPKCKEVVDKYLLE